ncbi:MAG: single-stranded DNA-binding protein [Calditrichaceae bacterium]|nr:single-stranded DNA-binding protein [Calditrichia bacterium]NUQ40415.1 single-stranded DNA-binding protein [Calditrichaceae bacterium]
MSKGTVNKVILVGRLGSDPEIRYTPSGAPVANFNIATDRAFKDKDGAWQNETTWHRIVLWNRQAEFAKEYLKKGNKVFVEGRIQHREWQDQNGQKRTTTEVVGFEVQMLDSPGQRAEAAGGAPPAQATELTPPEDMGAPPDDVPF